MKNVFKKYLLFVLASILSLLLLIVVFNYTSDPFQVYRISSVKPDHYFMDQDRFQNAGLINHLWRDRQCCDTVLLGTSHSQNFSAQMMDGVFTDRHVLNLSMSGATPAEEDFLLDRVLSIRKPETVIWEIHTTFATYSSELPEIQNPAANKIIPAYLYNDFIYDDLPYLFSLDTAKYAAKRYTQTVALDLHKDWYHRSLNSFGKGDMLLAKSRPLHKKDNVHSFGRVGDFESLDILSKRIADNPDINFVLFFPPYSRLFYANMSASDYDRLMAFRYALVKVMGGHKNVRIYSADLLDPRVENLDLYKDMGHYHPDIGLALMKNIVRDDGRLSEDSVVGHIRALTERVNSYCRRVSVDCLN